MAKKVTAPKEAKIVKLDSPILLPEGYKPSDKEDFMNPLQIEYFRQKLLKWREDLLTEANGCLLYTSPSPRDS